MRDQFLWPWDNRVPHVLSQTSRTSRPQIRATFMTSLRLSRGILELMSSASYATSSKITALKPSRKTDVGLRSWDLYRGNRRILHKTRYLSESASSGKLMLTKTVPWTTSKVSDLQHSWVCLSVCLRNWHLIFAACISVYLGKKIDYGHGKKSYISASSNFFQTEEERQDMERQDQM